MHCVYLDALCLILKHKLVFKKDHQQISFKFLGSDTKHEKRRLSHALILNCSLKRSYKSCPSNFVSRLWLPETCFIIKYVIKNTMYSIQTPEKIVFLLMIIFRNIFSYTDILQLSYEQLIQSSMTSILVLQGQNIPANIYHSEKKSEMRKLNVSKYSMTQINDCLMATITILLLSSKIPFGTICCLLTTIKK